MFAKYQCVIFYYSETIHSLHSHSARGFLNFQVEDRIMQLLKY